MEWPRLLCNIAIYPLLKRLMGDLRDKRLQPQDARRVSRVGKGLDRRCSYTTSCAFRHESNGFGIRYIYMQCSPPG